MPTNEASRPYIKILNIPQWIYGKIKRSNHATGVILPSGESYYIVHGTKISNEEFDAIFAVPEPIRNVNQFGDKMDGRQIND